MPYKLKPGVEDFEIMSGVDEGKKYVKNRSYDQAPGGYETRFEPVGAAPCDPLTKGQAQGPAPTEPADATGCASARAKARSRLKAVETTESEPTEKGE